MSTEARGERGPVGDHGQTGETGQRGPQGRDGAASNERGPKGDHGQDGLQGREGPRGAPGPEGRAATQGEDGKEGPAGRPGRSFTTRLLVLFVFVVGVFFVLAFRVQHNTDQIVKQGEKSRYANCLNAVVILEKFNHFTEEMAIIEKAGTQPGDPTYDESATPTRLKRVEAYKAAIQPIPTCVNPYPGERP